jgi:hypothetical protein
MLAVASALPLGVSVEFSSSDINGGGPNLDNIKASWSQDIKVLGNSATLDLSYDRSENSDFLDEATLSGSVEGIKYELTKKFGGDGIDFSLETSAGDGATIEANGSLDGGLTSVTASKSATFGSQDCDLEASYDVGSSDSKLKLSTVLGAGITGVATMTTSNVDYSFEYDTELTGGRTLSATVGADGSGEVEYVDEASIDATITATMDLAGGAPKVTVKRAWSF